MLRGDGPACVNLLSVANLYTPNPKQALALAFLSLSLSRSLCYDLELLELLLGEKL